MKTATIEQLAGYLPYGLTGICTDENQGIETVCGISFTENIIEVHTNIDCLDITSFKPLLRPLSDLTKPIKDAQGETVTHLLELAKIINKAFGDKWDLDRPLNYTRCAVCYTYDDVRYKFSFNGVSFEYETTWKQKSTQSINQLALFQYLYKNKFDLHGLLENGLAIKIED